MDFIEFIGYKKGRFLIEQLNGVNSWPNTEWNKYDRPMQSQFLLVFDNFISVNKRKIHIKQRSTI